MLFYQLFQNFNVFFRKQRRRDISGQDISDVHTVIYFQRFGDDARSVEFFVDHSAADGITVQTDQHIE